MPRPYIEPETAPSSNSSAEPPSYPPEKEAELSQSQQSSPSRSSQSGNAGEAEELSLEATEPFPPDLFRIPARDAFFREMPSLSDVALRSLLSLIHLSHRYDPAEERWIHTERWLSRSEIQEAAGVSSQGTRDGLNELVAEGWARMDREGRSHSYQLLLEVPDQRYTYIPTELLEKLDELGSTELRVALVVLRNTWGWTETKEKPKGGHETVHVRWTGLSNQDLCDATGRSETAVKRAAKGLENRWIKRVRPSPSEPYNYRFLPEAVADGSGEKSTPSEETSNEDTSKNLTPHRQKSDPPSSYRESLSRDKHSQPEEKKEPQESREPKAAEGENAMPSENTSEKKPPDTEPPPSPESDREPPDTKEPPHRKNSNRKTSSPDFSNLPAEKQELAQKLGNVGVWAGRVAEVLSRFSTERIRANFQLYRKRAAENTIHCGGAWLYRAITEGYTLPNSDTPAEASKGSTPEHKQVVSEEEKEAYINQGIPKERFQRCLSEHNGPTFMYFKPGVNKPPRTNTNLGI